MLGNCKNMAVIPSTTNEWPANHQIKAKILMGSSEDRVMEKPHQDPQQQQQEPRQQLKCPRCDSSNTKFCYYNNYSLAQPRHFCKACKRYWTRGGTLRNVPVGGGCRKNKKVKCSGAASKISSSDSASITAPNPSLHQPQMDISASTTNHLNPFLYSLLTSNSQFNYDSSHLQINGGGLGFSSSGGVLAGGVVPSAQILSNYPIFGRNSSAYSSIMSSTTSSSFLQQEKLASVGGFKDVQNSQATNCVMGFGSMDDVEMAKNGEGGQFPKDVKMEERIYSRLDWNLPNQSFVEHTIPSNPSLWNSSPPAFLFDPSNIGSSVTSLI